MVADSVSTYAHLVSIGITPVAVALPVGISPDYIVAVGTDYNREYCDRYRAAVPTFCFREVTATGTDRDITDTVTGIAAALGRADQGAAAIAAYDARAAALRERADYLLVNADDDVDRAALELPASPLWSRLAVVLGGRVRGASAWNGGDLPQLHRMLDDVERTLVVPAEAGR